VSGSRHVKVSIGVPVYNGARHIGRALDSLLAQTFPDFELIISDNASTDDTQRICEAYESRDQRVRYIRQKYNMGPLGNFNFVLNQAEGDYFMWAAHDDAWDSQFLETLLKAFTQQEQDIVAIGCEAQYTIDMTKQPFFSEGEAFYDILFESAAERVLYMLKHAYGNLFYSLYKRDCLFLNGVSVLSATARVSLNELPVFIPVALQGNWKILPEVLFYKETTMPTYEQARWEMLGGWLPFGSVRHFLAGIFYGIKYHILTALDLLRAVTGLPLSCSARIKLHLRVLTGLTGHFMRCLLHYKKRRELEQPHE